MTKALKFHYSNPKFKGMPWTIDHKPKKRHKKRRKVKIKNRPFIHPYKDRCLAYLKDFWDVFNTGKLDRMRLLQMAAKPGFPRVDHGLRKRLRKDFLKRYSLYLVGTTSECAICSVRKWEEKHHIVPLCFGGINDDINLIGICIGCHNEVHPWMKEA